MMMVYELKEALSAGEWMSEPPPKGKDDAERAAAVRKANGLPEPGTDPGDKVSHALNQHYRSIESMQKQVEELKGLVKAIDRKVTRIPVPETATLTVETTSEDPPDDAYGKAGPDDGGGACDVEGVGPVDPDDCPRCRQIGPLEVVLQHGGCDVVRFQRTDKRTPGGHRIWVLDEGNVDLMSRRVADALNGLTAALRDAAGHAPRR